VLIVEDERVDREIYKRFLRNSAAYRFEFAESELAGRGIEMSRTWAPDCILLDFNLPDMDGLEVLQQLRGDRSRPSCAVVMLTACGGEALAVNALKSGAMDYVPKGQVVGDVLPHCVANAIERFQMQQRIEEQRSALEKSAARYQTLLEAIPHMVWMANAEGQVEYGNRLWFEYGGLDLEQGGPMGWDRLVHPQDQEKSLAAWEKARQSGQAFEVEHRLKRAADGAYRWHLVRAVPFLGPGQEIASWFGTCTEIENQKQAESLNLQKEKVHGIGLLAAGVAHDFNNLLVAILGGASFVMENLPPAHPAQSMLDGVVRAAERAAELTGKMLAYAGKANMCIEPTDLNRLVRETCDALRVSIPKTIRLHIQPGRDVPPVTTDSRQLRQAIIDLVRNAVEAIREGATGTISVRTGIEEVPEESPAVAAGRYVLLEVRDTGCGMSEETQKRIFDPFFTTKFTGRGLGLAAVQGFIRSSGGDVQVYSRPGRGSRFRILLPSMPAQAKVSGVAC
jgi:two-component system, cell cycle sensor histidine kinase and response regulator CckA